MKAFTENIDPSQGLEKSLIDVSTTTRFQRVGQRLKKYDPHNNNSLIGSSGISQTLGAARYGRVLLTRLAYAGYLGNVDIFPVGLGYLSEVLKEAGIDYEILDLGLSTPEQEEALLAQKIRQYQPDLLGVSMMTLGYRAHYRLLDDLKQQFPDLGIVMGGAHISTVRHDVLRECRSISYGVVMEGEETLLELCQKEYPLQEIKGLLFREEDGEVVYNGDRHFIKNLDDVPYPLYEKYPMNKYNPDIPLVTSRGCPYACTFCPVADAIGKLFRVRTPENILKEMEFWYVRGYRQFSIWDDNFTLHPDRAWEFCELLQQKGWNDIRLSIPNGIRADRVDRALLERMYAVGFRQISLGVESGVNAVLKAIKKDESVDDLEEAIKHATEVGFEVYLYFIIGLPTETYADFEKSLEFAKKYEVAEARFYNLVPFPATELFDWAAENKLFLQQPSEFLNKASHFLAEPTIATPEFSTEERIRAYKKALKVTNWQRYRWRARQLKRFGLLGRLIAWVSTSEFYATLFKGEWLRMKVILPLKQFLGLHQFSGNPTTDY